MSPKNLARKLRREVEILEQRSREKDEIIKIQKLELNNLKDRLSRLETDLPIRS